jgi:hypothetical protein
LIGVDERERGKGEERKDFDWGEWANVRKI